MPFTTSNLEENTRNGMINLRKIKTAFFKFNDPKLRGKNIFKYFLFALIIGFLFYAGTVSKYSEITFITQSYLFSLIILIIFLLFLIYILIFGDKVNSETLNPLPYITILVFVFLISTSIVKCDSVFETYRIMTPMALFLIIINLIESNAERKFFTFGFLLFGIYMGILNYIIFYKEAGFYGGVLSSNWGYQNTFAAFLVLMSFLGFGFYLNETDKNLKMLLFTVPVFFNFLLFLTVSRGGYIAFILSAVILIIISGKDKVAVIKNSVPVIAGSIALILVGAPKDIILRNLGKEKVLTGFIAGSRNFSLWCRVHMAHLATIIFSKRPLTGFGLGSFRYTFGMFEWIGEPFRIDPHSLFFKLLSETGIIGTAAFFAFIAFYLWKAYKASKSRDFIYKAFFSGLIGMFFHMLIDVDIYPFMFVLLFLGLGILVPENFIEIKRNTKRKVFIVTVTTVVMLLFNLFPKTIASIYALKAENPYMHSSIDEAIRFSYKATKLEPDCAQFTNLLANNLTKKESKEINMKKINKIEKLFIQAYNLNKYDRRYPFEIGIMELYKKNPDSVKYLEAARKLYPTNPHTLSWLAVSYAYLENDISKAKMLINEAEKFDTEHSLDIMFAKGVLAAKEGSTDKAQQYFSRLALYNYIFDNLGGFTRDYAISRYFISKKIVKDIKISD